MWTALTDGDTAHRWRVEREMRSMSCMAKGTCASCRRGEQVQHGIGRAAHGDVEPHRVSKARSCDAGGRACVPVAVPAAHQLQDAPPRREEQAAAIGVSRDQRAVAGQREAERLD